jgi:hypothetical protein
VTSPLHLHVVDSRAPVTLLLSSFPLLQLFRLPQVTYMRMRCSSLRPSSKVRPLSSQLPQPVQQLSPPLGLLGGWSTLQSTTSAYISDCTSSGSRAHIFSRFTGVFYLGFCLSPIIGAFFIRHFGHIAKEGIGKEVTSVFWVAMICELVNFLLALFVFPESLPPSKRSQPSEDEGNRHDGILRQFLNPLTVFLPTFVDVGGGRRGKDWSLTFLAAALFGFTLSAVCHMWFAYALSPYTF